MNFKIFLISAVAVFVLLVFAATGWDADATTEALAALLILAIGWTVGAIFSAAAFLFKFAAACFLFMMFAGALTYIDLTNKNRG